jgi:hypothetical protein
MRRAILAAGVLAGCVDHRAGISGTQSLGVELVSPADPGAIDRRLPDAVRVVTLNLTAYDADFNVDATFDRDVQVYAQFLGTVTPTPTLSSRDGRVATPLATFHLTAGKAMNQSVTLPAVLGPTTLWIEDGPHGPPGGRPDPSYAPTYASGTSPALWFRDPFVFDIQHPDDEMRVDALEVSPLQNKQISVDASRYGAVGRLVVTSVFAQGYTVSDVACTDRAGTPPCTAAAYDHVEVFSRSAPRDQMGRLLQQGQVIDGFTGGVSDVDGLTEIGSPATVASDPELDAGRLPAPVKLDPATWFQPLPDPGGIINFERNEAGAIEIDNGRVCDLDADYATFKRWKVDPLGVGGDCSHNRDVVQVITAGAIAGLEPASLVGKTLPRIAGILRPVETGSFHVWIIVPRSSGDLTLP